MIYKFPFTNDDLDMDYQLLVTHNLGTSDIVPAWKDDSGVFRVIGDLLQVIDDNNVMLSCGGAITGTNYLYLSYESAGTSTAGRRAFELTTTDDPAGTMRLIMGKASTPAVNMTIATFLTWIYSKLGFLKVTSNLSDLNNKSTARSNLSVYSQTQVDEALALKATLYQAGSGSVLGTANTSVYNPSAKYHPATLRNVNNVGMQIILAGSGLKDGSAATETYRNSNVLAAGFTYEKTATGTYNITHNLGSTSYMVMVVATSSASFEKFVGFTKLYKFANYFTIHFGDDTSLNDSDFEFVMFRLNTYQPNE